MRVTLQMSTLNSVYNINSNASKVYELAEQISTGYAVTNPSDNPVATIEALEYSQMLSMSSMYQNNIEQADTYMGLTDNSLSEVNTILTEAQTLAIDMSGGNNTADMYVGSTAEMTSLLSSLVNVANTDYAGQYLFAGTDNSEEAFEIVGDKYVYFKGNNDDLDVIVDSNSSTAMNTTAEDAFGNLETTIASNDLERVLNLSESNSTRLEDLNSGEGVSDGSITLYYSSAPSSLGGLTVDLSAADTLEDVASYIEQASVNKADSYDATDPEYNYILDVSLNDDMTALEITQIDRTTGLPVDLDDSVLYPDASSIVVKSSLVSKELGLDGMGSTTGESTLEGQALNAVITVTTLISDLRNWDNDSLTIYNGSEDNTITAIDTGDASEYFSQWQLTGLSDGVNVVDDGNLYYQMTDLGSGDWEVNIYNSESMDSTSLVATGTSDGGLLEFDEVRNSGISGTVNFAPLSSSTDPIDGVLAISFPTSYSATIDVADFELEGEEIGSTGINTSELISDIDLFGLEKGSTTDSEGKLDVVVECTASGTYAVSVLNDGDLMLSGEMLSGSSGVVELEPAAGYEDLGGSITLDCADSIVTTGSYDVSVQATFNTVEDITNAIDSSSTYTTAQISDDGKSIEVASQLCGAYLTVAQNYEGATVSGDTLDQLSYVDLNGVVSGINSDDNGKLYASVTESFDVSTSGTYSVEFYSDSTMSTLVAQAETTDINGEVVVSPVDDSGISGTLYLNYVGDSSQIEVSSTPITSIEDEFDQISQVDITGLINGENCGYSGELYIEVENVSGVSEVSVYSDSEHENLVASGSVTGSGVVTLSEENSSGIAGSLYLDYQAESADIVIAEESANLSGREMEDNIFATFSRIIDAMVDQDCYAVNDELDNLDTDLNRVLSARATIGSNQNYLTMLTNRHTSNDDLYTEGISNAIEVDLIQASTDYSAQKTAYEASLSVTSQLMSMSLLDYI